MLSRRVHTIGEKVHDAHYAHKKSFSKQVNRSGEEPFVSRHQRYSEAQKHRELRERLVRVGIARPEQEIIPEALPISIQQLAGALENVAFRLGSSCRFLAFTLIYCPIQACHPRFTTFLAVRERFFLAPQ